MSFERIQDFLSRYRKYFSDKDEERKVISTVVEQISGISLSQNEFVVLRGDLVITGNSVLKNELFMYKEKILAKLHKNGLTKINTIR